MILKTDREYSITKARIYVSVQNLYTFTGYKGLDPEVGYGGDSKMVR